MARRDFITEILSKKSRLYPDTNRWNQVSVRLAHLRQTLEFLQEMYPELEESNETLQIFYKDVPYELRRYFPIAFVACIEGYFRIVYANLIDHGSPFRDNATKFDIKFSIEMALSIQRHSVSLGEFIAHLLSHNNLDDIDKNMSNLIGESFLARVKQMRAKLPRQTSIFPEFELDADARLLSQIKGLFELRHIYSHELSPFTPPDSPSVDACVEAAVEFLWITESIVNELLSTPNPS
jgi:hypothetical protein